MDLNSIRAAALSMIKSLPSRLKTIYRLPFFKTYMFVAIIMTIFFTIVTFPYELIVRDNIQQLEKKSLRSIIIGHMDINLIGDSYFDNVNMTLLGGDELSFKSAVLNASLNPVRLILNRHIISDILLDKIQYSSEKVHAFANMTGNMDITLENKTGIPADGMIKALMENIIINLDKVTLPDNMGGFSLPPSIKISSISLDCIIENKKMTIKNLLVSGSDLRGNITGSILLMPITGNSKLELMVSIDPESALLSEFKPLLKSFTDASGKISFPLKGTLSRPHPELGRRGASDRNEPESMESERREPERREPGKIRNRRPGPDRQYPDEPGAGALDLPQ